jgi:hypothetical protein
MGKLSWIVAGRRGPRRKSLFNVKLASVLLALLLGGCQALTSYRDEEKAKEAVAKLLIDPSSAAFTKIEVRGGHVCGLVNGKNRTGAYAGFKKFLVDMSGWKAEIDPEMDYGDLLSARDLCTSMRDNSYASLASTLSACDRASELESEQVAQVQFNSAWNAHCQSSARLPFQPPLGNVSEAVSEAASEPSDNVGAAAPDVDPGEDMAAGNMMNVDMNATNTNDNEIDE